MDDEVVNQMEEYVRSMKECGAARERKERSDKYDTAKAKFACPRGRTDSVLLNISFKYKIVAVK